MELLDPGPRVAEGGDPVAVAGGKAAARQDDRAGADPLKISIVTPNYNMGHLLEQTILSVLQQCYARVEHIVVDGGSSDNSLEIIERYPHLTWVSEPDDGLYHALNKGLAMATGDVVGWCNADDLYLPGAFKYVDRYFRRHPSVAMLYGDYREIDEDGVAFRVKRETQYNAFVARWLHVNHVPTPSAFWRRAIHDGGIWFDQSYRYANDLLFCYEVARAGHRIRHVDTLLADFRRHDGAISTAFVEKQTAEAEAIVRRHAGAIGRLPDPFYRPIRQVMLMAARGWRTTGKVARGSYFEYWRG